MMIAAKNASSLDISSISQHPTRLIMGNRSGPKLSFFIKKGPYNKDTEKASGLFRK